VETTGEDEQPRGFGRVVNHLRDLDKGSVSPRTGHR
jgi:hypothetical protein